MAGIVVSNKVRRLVGNRLKEIDVPTATLNTALYYADLTAQGASFTQSRVNAELNAYPTVVKNNASLALTPNANKEGVVYAMNGDTKTLEEFEFQRGSSATYFDASGVMQLAAPNVPRINFENGASKGLLIEPSGSNLKLNSGFTEGVAHWSGGFTVVDTNWNIGSLLAKGAQANNTQNIWWGGSGIVEGKHYTLSFFAKLNDGSTPKIGTASGDDFVFLIANTPVNPTITPIGNGVFFISASRVVTAGDKTTGIYKAFGASSTKIVVASGFQLEESSVPTSYIPTTSAIATRLADKVLSKRPIAVFPKNSIFVKPAEYSSVWFGNGADNLTALGRNLLGKSRNYNLNIGKGFLSNEYYLGFPIIKYIGKGALYEDIFTQSSIIPPRGNTYVVSFYAKASANLEFQCNFYAPNTTTSSLSSTGHSGSLTDGSVKVAITTNWQKYWVKWTQSDTTAVKQIIVARILNSNDTVEIAGIKLEEGSSDTLWSPAPEDYIKVDVNGNIEISYDIPIHIQQLSLISRELNQEEI